MNGGVTVMDMDERKRKAAEYDRLRGLISWVAPLLNRLREFVEDESAVRRASFMPEPSAGESAQIKEAEELLAELHARLTGENATPAPLPAIADLAALVEALRDINFMTEPSGGDWGHTEVARISREWIARLTGDSGASLESRVEGWRDIETAPKDGTLVDLWVIYRYGIPARQANCYWNAEENMWVNFYGVWRRASHWIPIPLPPIPTASAPDSGEAQK